MILDMGDCVGLVEVGEELGLMVGEDVAVDIGLGEGGQVRAVEAGLILG